MELERLPAGEFTMGSPEDEPGRVGNETRHQVTLTQAFEMGVHEVTQTQYERVMGATPSNYKGPQNPVDHVSWHDAVEFCRKLSEMPAEKAAGYVYRLPTEAEWEYACRAGTKTAYSFGDSDAQLGDYAWYDENSEKTTYPVGQKKPNAWGLYDMHGNVFEWCRDCYGVYPSAAATAPIVVGAVAGSRRVHRGGGWTHDSDYCRSANRIGDTPDYRNQYLGFRVVCSSIK